MSVEPERFPERTESQIIDIKAEPLEEEEDEMLEDTHMGE